MLSPPRVRVVGGLPVRPGLMDRDLPILSDLESRRISAASSSLPGGVTVLVCSIRRRSEIASSLEIAVALASKHYFAVYHG